MTDASIVTRKGETAVLVRLFGWVMLGLVAAFLINNVLLIGWGMPTIGDVISGKAGTDLWVPLLIYGLCIVVAAGHVFSSANNSLRWDAGRIHRFNCYIIRACFWAVLLVGVADVLVSFMRVEGGLDALFGDEFGKNFGKPSWIGLYIHMPMVALGFVLALFTRTLGFHWLALLIVAAELGIVISRFGFSYEQALMGDLVRYWYAALFLFASAYTLYEDGHVRVDVLYAGFGPTTKGMVNAFGTILLGVATAWVILYIGLNGKQSIINSPVVNFEVTQSGQNGMFVKYQMAAFLGVFAVTMLVQFVSYFFEAWADWRGEPGKREFAPAAH